MIITYLLNSGFLLEAGNYTAVFDAYADPSGTLRRTVGAGGYGAARRLDFFASHVHGDHYSPQIFDYAPFAAKYFLSFDIKGMAARRSAAAGKTIFLSPYEHYEDAKIAIDSYSSTDEGISFALTLKQSGEKIFHAGDFNWWHWLGDTDENNAFARQNFFSQLERLKGASFDLAFFPVDGRLESAAEWGANEFLKAVRAKALVAMHRAGYPRWTPGKQFFADTLAGEIPVFAPVKSGERVRLSESGFEIYRDI